MTYSADWHCSSCCIVCYSIPSPKAPLDSFWRAFSLRRMFTIRSRLLYQVVCYSLSSLYLGRLSYFVACCKSVTLSESGTLCTATSLSVSSIFNRISHNALILLRSCHTVTWMPYSPVGCGSLADFNLEETWRTVPLVISKIKNFK